MNTSNPKGQNLTSNDIGNSKQSTGWKTIKASACSLRLKNPIRDIVDRLKVPTDNPKPLISLSIGDPTQYGNLANPTNINDALIENIKSRKFNGYTHSAGHPETRKAIARKYSIPDLELTIDDIVVTSGCSGALELAITALASSGQNVLLPAPGFSIYQTICEYLGIEPRDYRLLPERDWEANLQDIESQIDENTAAIIVNNPSNPCGSVYSKEHLEAILKIAEKHHLPIIADEIYGELVFENRVFYPIASLTKTVPVLSVGAISKVYLTPGWRVGWIIIYDRLNLFSEVRTGLVKLSQLILGANTIVQSVIEESLFHTPKSYYDELNSTLQKNAEYLVKHLSKIPGLKVVSPGGAMYMMVGLEIEKFQDIQDDVEFAQKLLQEQMVVVLPAKIFKSPLFFRLVICPPMEKLEDAVSRIEEFCKKHRKGAKDGSDIAKAQNDS